MYLINIIVREIMILWNRLKGLFVKQEVVPIDHGEVKPFRPQVKRFKEFIPFEFNKLLKLGYGYRGICTAIGVSIESLKQYRYEPDMLYNRKHLLISHRLEKLFKYESKRLYNKRRTIHSL